MNKLKKLIFAFCLFALSINAYSSCIVDIENINSKYQLSKKLIEVISYVQTSQDEQDEIFSKENTNTMILGLASAKRIIGRTQCDIEQLISFNNSSKDQIVSASSIAIDYLNKRLSYNKNLRDFLLIDNHPSNKIVREKTADLYNEKLGLMTGTITLGFSLLYVISYDESDGYLDVSQKYSDIEKRSWMGLNKIEKDLIFSEIQKLMQNPNLLFGFSFNFLQISELFGYKNKNLKTLDDIKNLK